MLDLFEHLLILRTISARIIIIIIYVGFLTLYKENNFRTIMVLIALPLVALSLSTHYRRSQYEAFPESQFTIFVHVNILL